MTDRPARGRKIVNAEARTPVVFAPRRKSSAHLEQISTRIVFFIAGFGMAAWAPLVPFAKARLGMTDGGLGLLLLCLGIGSIVAMPLAGAFAARMGCRRVIIVSTLMICLALPLLAVVPSLPLLVAALLLFGAGLGAVDVSINIQAIIVERASGCPMMSGFHGFFSLGGIVGAAGATALLSAGVLPVTATLVVVACIAVALIKAAPHLLPSGGRSEGPIFAFPRGVVWFIGGLCFIMFLTEGAVLDWSAVFLTSARGLGPSYAGLGYAAFALTMTVGRLSGDRIVQHVGRVNIVFFGGLCAAAGFTLMTCIPSWPVGLLGYALVGAGCCNVVPVLFSSVGRQTAMPENVAVPAVTGLGYTGILLGPAAIGLVAHAASLSAAFLILALMLVGVAWTGRLLRV
jgi:predicted MFS family arabinose efflux permease